MKRFINKKNLNSFLLMLLIAFTTSCVKKEFDEPPANGQDPNLKANLSIDSLKIKYYHAGQVDTIKDDVIIQGIVIADDKSGNFYKTMVIQQDSTAGISVRLDMSNFYTEYPIGRRVFIKCKGMVIGDYGGLIQIGGYVDYTAAPPEVAPIPSSLVTQYIFPGVYNLTVAPKVLSIGQLNNKYQNMLVQLKDVEFTNADANQPYANNVTFSSVNRMVEDCGGNSIILRTSGYANFAGDSTPNNKGTLTAVYSIFNVDKQLIIRNLNDVVMNDPRCGSGPVTAMTFAEVRDVYNNGSMVCPNALITGIVISDAANGNINNKNLILQDTTAGILVRFTAAHSFQLGDKVEVNIAGLSFYDYNGLLEVNNAPLTAATKIGTGTVTPRAATFDEIVTNSEAWESTLVTTATVSFPATAGSYSGSVALTDPTNAVTLYTGSGASFSASPYPNTGTHTLTAIVSQFTTLQLNIRNLTDVQ